MKLAAMVCEALARERLTWLLIEEGAHGYTLFSVKGAGAKGSRMADIAEFSNIQAEAIVPAPVAERLMARLQWDFFPHFAVIVYETDVRVLRQEKF